MTNKKADTDILKDIHEMFEMVQLEAMNLKFEYIPQGAKYDDLRRKREQIIIEFKAAQYRKWLLKKIEKYRHSHEYLTFCLGTMYTIEKPCEFLKGMEALKRNADSMTLKDRSLCYQRAERDSLESTCNLVTKRKFDPFKYTPKSALF